MNFWKFTNTAAGSRYHPEPCAPGLTRLLQPETPETTVEKTPEGGTSIELKTIDPDTRLQVTELFVGAGKQVVDDASHLPAPPRRQVEVVPFTDPQETAVRLTYLANEWMEIRVLCRSGKFLLVLVSGPVTKG